MTVTVTVTAVTFSTVLLTSHLLIAGLSFSFLMTNDEKTLFSLRFRRLFMAITINLGQ